MLLSAVSVLVVAQSSSEIPEGLMNNSVYIYIYMKFTVYMAVSFITFCHILLVPFYYHCIHGCKSCVLLFNFVNYVFLLLCMFGSGCSVSLCCSVYCLCVNVYCNTATGCQPNCS